jgi:hypothetical protein
VRFAGLFITTLLLSVSAGAQVQPDRLIAMGDDQLRGNRIARALDLYHAALRQNPMHEGAYLRLLRIDRARKLPDDAARRDALAREFPEGFFLRQTEHYLILYDAHHTWADTRATLLESTHDVFLSEMRKAGFRPLPVRHRLQAVLFNQHRDYAEYATRVDGMENDWSAGHYSPRSNRLIVFNFHTSPLMGDLLRQMRQAEATVERRRGEAAANPGRTGALRAAERQMLIARKHYETAAAWGNIRQTLHEAVHQLAFNTNIQRRDVSYPMWFSEGIATAFETAHPAVPFGPSHINHARLHELNDSRKKRQLIPLDRFVGMRQPPGQEGQRTAAYAQSWAVFHMLFNERTEQLRAYVNDMLTARPGPRNEQEHRADFIKHFGPIKAFEAEFNRHIAKLNG